MERPRIKRYIKIFAKSFVMFAIFAWFIESSDLGVVNGTISAILISLAWVLIMAIIFIPIDYSKTRKLPIEAFNVRQKRYIQVQGNIEDVFFKLQDFLKTLKNIKKVTASRETLVISARTKLTFETFGEKITLKLDTSSKDFVGIYIDSFPVVRFTLMDYGHNFKNIEYLSKELMKINKLEQGQGDAGSSGDEFVRSSGGHNT
jgi:hypothetical protein